MRFVRLLRWDMRFQARYGFYLLYGFLTALYTLVLVSLPPSWRSRAAALLIFSDPAAMGLFFMGAIILLEKSQRVTPLLAGVALRCGVPLAEGALVRCAGTGAALSRYYGLLDLLFASLTPAMFCFGLSFLPSFWMGKAVLESRLLFFLPAVAAAGGWIALLWRKARRACR